MSEIGDFVRTVATSHNLEPLELWSMIHVRGVSSNEEIVSLAEDMAQGVA